MKTNDREDFKEVIIVKGKNKTDEIESFVVDSVNECIHIKFSIQKKSIIMQ